MLLQLTYFDILGIDWLDIYVGTDYVGSLQANLGFTYVPDCFPEDPDAVHFTLYGKILQQLHLHGLSEMEAVLYITADRCGSSKQLSSYGTNL